ncbi:hypothetical protein B0I35DRAFT_434106 [Stachybotrys elegans]|uniref:Uncharacterized protein n=1 Tax=Stachybotrys elegans TaxID=80388 RepID=A0A8K0SQA9_9HYPO|nr:hypothetical protein B0I35DRAFT_434106 [Stachybotrys elegans]
MSVCLPSFPSPPTRLPQQTGSSLLILILAALPGPAWPGWLSWLPLAHAFVHERLEGTRSFATRLVPVLPPVSTLVPTAQSSHLPAARPSARECLANHALNRAPSSNSNTRLPAGAYPADIRIHDACSIGLLLCHLLPLPSPL